jgi:hypothetical protein
MRKIEFAGPTTHAKTPVRMPRTLKPDSHPPYHPTEIAPSSFVIETEIRAQLQERTNDLLQELRAELGKDAANQFISIRSAVYYGDNGLPGIDPQALMGPGSPNADESWKSDFTQDSDYSAGNVTMSSNHDLDEILDPSLGPTGGVSYESNPPFDDQGSDFEAGLAIPLCQRCTCEKCKKLRERAKQKRGKRASLHTVASLFPRLDLINMLDKY